MFPGRLGKLCGWALQGYSAVGHCRDTWWLGTARILWLGTEDTLRLGTAGILCGWALQEYVAIEHCSQAPGGGRGQHRLENLTTPQRGWGNIILTSIRGTLY